MGNVNVNDYWRRIINIPVEERSVEELAISVEASIDLEIEDNGFSGFDIMYEQNPKQFPSLMKVRDELESRGIMTKKQFDDWVIGMDENYHRIGNQYSFLEWCEHCGNL